MTKAELSDELAKATGLTKQESAGSLTDRFGCPGWPPSDATP